MKKLVSVLLAAGLVASMTACGGGDKKESAAAPAETTAAAAETTKADEKETEKVTEAVTEAAKDLADAGEISVLYYTYGDTYISSVPMRKISPPSRTGSSGFPTARSSAMRKT